MPLLHEIQDRIFHTFNNPEYLRLAVTHKSYANENRTAGHNERMEFLGDAVLNLVVTEYLMQSCPASSEGDLSKLRAAVVNESALAIIARSFELGDYLFLGKGEEQTGGRGKDSLLANTLEALVGALYLDAGIEAARSFILRFFTELLTTMCAQRLTLDYKTELQEICQDRLKQLPEYHVVSESGPDHQKQFEVEISIKGRIYGRGCGRNKKEAEQRAAKTALEKLTDVKVQSPDIRN